MKKKVILYGSLTGNTQMTAMSLADKLGCECVGFDDVTQEIIDKYNVFIIGVSTWGEGEFNPATEDWVAKLNAGSIKFENKEVALFGMGDSSYQIFCGAVDRLAEILALKNNKRTGEIHKIDGFLDDEKESALVKWADNLLL